MKPAIVCKILGVQNSTLRKYCLAMEKEGYTFQKSEKGHRIFTEKNVITIKEIIDCMRNNAITLENAIIKVLNIRDNQKSVSQLIAYYTERESRLKAMYEIELQLKEKQIATLKEQIIQLEYYQTRKEVAATHEQPSLLKRIYRLLIPL